MTNRSTPARRIRAAAPALLGALIAGAVAVPVVLAAVEAPAPPVRGDLATELRRAADGSDWESLDRSLAELERRLDALPAIEDADGGGAARNVVRREQTVVRQRQIARHLEERVHRGVERRVASVRARHDRHWELLGERAGGRAERFGDHLAARGDAWDRHWDRVGERMGECWGRFGERTGERWGSFGERIGEHFGSLGERIGESFGSLGESIGESFGSFGERTGERWGRFGERTGSRFDRLGSDVGERFENLGDELPHVLELSLETAFDAFDTLLDSFEAR